MDFMTPTFNFWIVFFGIIYLYMKRHYGYWARRGIPCGRPHLLMGNVQGIRSKISGKEIIGKYYQTFKGCGPFAGIFILQKRAVVPLDKELIKRILTTDFSYFTDRCLYGNEPLTTHLGTADGYNWLVMRSKLSSAFTESKMKYMYPTMMEVTQELVSILEEKVQTTKLLDMRDLLGRYTVDVIGLCIMGVRSKSLTNPDDKYFALIRKSLSEYCHNRFVMTFIDGFPWLARKMGLRTLPKDVDQYFMTTIRDAVVHREKHKIRHNDFLDILIDYRNNEFKETGKYCLTLEEIAGQVFIFYQLGYESGSSTISYALHELAHHPEVQERLRNEVKTVFAKYKATGMTFEAINELTYTWQVISETLRKYPLVACVRKAARDYVVPDRTKYVIQKGTPVLVPVLGIHYDPEFYPNPHEFDPDRFSPENVAKRDPIEWLPFGDGPRNCIGMRFGKMLTCLGLASVIHNFRYAPCSKCKARIQFAPNAILLTPSHPICLNVERI